MICVFCLGAEAIRLQLVLNMRKNVLYSFRTVNKHNALLQRSVVVTTLLQRSVVTTHCMPGNASSQPSFTCNNIHIHVATPNDSFCFEENAVVHYRTLKKLK